MYKKYYFVFALSLFLQLADFGLSNRFQRNSLLQTYCGSPLYAAPEIVKGLPYQGPEVSQYTAITGFPMRNCFQTFRVFH